MFRLARSIHWRSHRALRLRRIPTFPVIQRRQLSANALGSLRSGGLIANILAGAYLGGLVVCFGSLYLLYHDADKRQHIPLLVGLENTVIAVKGIGKDDVLKLPRHAVKHYRRLLANIGKDIDPDYSFEETVNGQRNYLVPLVSSEDLLQKKGADFANFYIDIVLRYTRALLAKEHVAESRAMLKQIIDNDEVFYRLGDAERMSQCSRLLSGISFSADEKEYYLKRAIDMLAQTFLRVHIKDFLLQEDLRISDELIHSLNGLAFLYASESKSVRSKKEKQALLSKALNIYLANLKRISSVEKTILSGELTQASYPLFNCDEENLKMLSAEIKCHVSEILWAKNFKDSAVAWGEEVVDEIYFDHKSIARATPILSAVLDNLVIMYGRLKDKQSQERCMALREDLNEFETDPPSWYDSVVQRFTKIIYYKGPLGVLEKALKERFGPPEKTPELEEHEDEDQE